MTDLNEIIYPKVTSIYNKLLQIGVAIILLLMILNLSIMGMDDSEKLLENHFNTVAKQYLEQSVNTSKVLLVNKNKKQLQAFVQSLSDSDLVTEARLYDAQGQTIAESERSTSVSTLVGIEQGSIDNSDLYVPFIKEIRTDKLIGYIRLNLVKDQVIDTMQVQIYSQFELFRIMLIIAVFAGFLLTRGFNRFSRQGLRVSKPKATKAAATNE
ncbi:AhpA/YtjB family protein [Thalassotalea nanhaiensis]|uniref:AhpA/YtjB family protein n=1 Tax=Thalassotalea nanhaiensis TaxID=3065648 RepID=A0ABY9TGL3_9GAMM|nr:AhpA/YtjB family protein [Colwelliaceae bacterium SQ345]